MKRDNIHFNFREIDGYNKTFNFIISPREPGKSTAFWLDKAWKVFKEKKQTSIVIRRRTVHITDKYITDIEKIINKFKDEEGREEDIKISYNKGAKKEGLVEVSCSGKPFFLVVSLSADIAALKSTLMPNLRYIVFDEFICNPKFKEKYLDGEVDRFFELYKTYRREAVLDEKGVPKLTCYFLGNPYSLFNPYFLYFGLQTSTFKNGTIQSGSNWCAQNYKMKEELKEKLKKEDPLFEEENDYLLYALEGQAVNDKNILISKHPQNFLLSYVFKIGNTFIGTYRSLTYEEEFVYYAEFLKKEEISKRRNIYVFDLFDMENGTILMSNDDKIKFQRMKEAIRKRLFAFASIECYYLLVEIYKNI